MEHSFDVAIAKRYGVTLAILLKHFEFWIAKNKANNKNYFDGNYWTYNSRKAFAELFPYLNARQIEYAIKKLVDDGLIVTGNYNKSAYDRTLWYAITKKGYSILQNCEMEVTKSKNGFDEIVTPIPDINTDTTNTDINTDIFYTQKQEGKKQEVENQPLEIQPLENHSQENTNKLNTNKQSKEYINNIIYIVDFLNSTLNTRYRYQTQTTQKLIKARLNEGFTVDDFKTVIKKKADEWKGTEMAVFLRPETLFGTKFESYFNAPKKTKGSSNKTEHFENEREYSQEDFDKLLKNVDDIIF